MSVANSSWRVAPSQFGVLCLRVPGRARQTLSSWGGGVGCWTAPCCATWRFFAGGLVALPLPAFTITGHIVNAGACKSKNAAYKRRLLSLASKTCRSALSRSMI